MNYVNKEPIVIPAGTVFYDTPVKTTYVSEHKECNIELGPDNTMTLIVPVEENDPHFNEVFTKLKE